MKKKITIVVVAGFIAVALVFGCKKKSNPKVYPNVSNFSASAPSGFVVNATGNILISSTSLSDGYYTIRYTYRRLTDTVDSKAQFITLVMSGHSGSFQTQVMDNSYAPLTYFTLDSITNSSGNAVALTTNNFVTLVDSIGVINVFSASSANSFKALHVAAFITDTNLLINGIYYVPGNTDRKVLAFKLSNVYTTGTYNISTTATGSPGSLLTYSGNNMATDTVRYGTVTFTAIYPIYIGTFSFTFNDSLKIYGSFNINTP